MQNRFSLLGEVSCDVRVTDIVIHWASRGSLMYGDPEYHAVPDLYQTREDGELYNYERLIRLRGIITQHLAATEWPKGGWRTYTLLDALLTEAQPAPKLEIGAQIVFQFDKFSKKNPLNSAEYRANLAQSFYSLLHKPW